MPELQGSQMQMAPFQGTDIPGWGCSRLSATFHPLLNCLPCKNAEFNHAQCPIPFRSFVSLCCLAAIIHLHWRQPFQKLLEYTGMTPETPSPGLCLHAVALKESILKSS